MTITQAIKWADELRANTIRTDQKAEWLIALDKQLSHRMGVDEPDYQWPTEDKDLLLPSPYDEVYQLYLCCRIDYYNNETTMYGNDKAVYESALDEALCWWRQTHCPAGGQIVKVM